MATLEKHITTARAYTPAKQASTERIGGSGPRSTTFERFGLVRTYLPEGSHMPVDTDIHWTWNGLLSILLVFLTLIATIGFIGMALTFAS